MNPEGTKILDEGVTVFDGHAHHPTIEGPKFYKRGAYYYIFAPAGGVKPGWQTVLRSKTITGPYEDRIVLDQGRTAINGPHQGAWIDTPKGEDWFIHFQDCSAYGRIVHLQPMVWKDDWPVIGYDREGTGKGEPVLVHAKPNVEAPHQPIVTPQTSDEFNHPSLGLQWQYQANHKKEWASLTQKKGVLTLRAVDAGTDSTMWTMPHLLLQKFPARSFTVTTRVNFEKLADGERTGLVVFGLDYYALRITNHPSGAVLELVSCKNANAESSRERVETSIRLGGGQKQIDLRVSVDTAAVCRFSMGMDGTTFALVGEPHTVREGLWVGAKVGIFATASPLTHTQGYAEYD
jgi:beta-xylosidase